MTRAPAKLVVALAATFAIVGCNAILDNEDGQLVSTDEAGTSPAPGATGGDDGSVPPPVDNDGGNIDNEAGPVPESGVCPGGQHQCNGLCVSDTDPVYGCGDPSCSPCPGDHATFACAANACTVTACDAGYANCNGQAVDGCETDLSKPATCGACNATCATATPLCAAEGTGFACTNGCTPTAPVVCNDACVDLNSSVDNCGACNVQCAAVANSVASCNAGVCGTTCKAFFHACGGACVSTTDPTACGPACTVCPVPTGGAATCVLGTCAIKCTAPLHSCSGACVADDVTACGAACTPCVAPANATATCADETCGFTCNPGFGDCDGNAANGCEANLETDSANCGKCKMTCGLGLLSHCDGGTCKVL